MMNRIVLAAAGLTVASSVGLSAARSGSVSEAKATARRFLIAIYQNDQSTAAKEVVTEEGLDEFIGGQKLDDQSKAAVESEIDALELEPNVEIVDDRLPVGTLLRLQTGYRGVPIVVTTKLTEEGWKVDLRWWRAMLRMARDQGPSDDDPEFIIKTFLLALMQRDEEVVRELLIENAEVDSLYPSNYVAPFEDQYFYLATEMPLVEASSDDIVLNAAGNPVSLGRILSSDRTFVGLFGVNELVISLRKGQGGLRVVPGPFLSQIGLVPAE